MESFVSPKATLAFPALFVAKPKGGVAGAPSVYNCTLIFDAAARASQQYVDMEKFLEEVIDAKFGKGKFRDAGFRKVLKYPLRPAEQKAGRQGFDAGCTFCSPWTKNPVPVFDSSNILITDPDRVWAGQRVRAEIVPFASDKSGNKSAGFLLNAVKIIRADLPRFDGRTTTASAFDQFTDEDEQEAEASETF